MNNIQAIETFYKGIRFRSRLEARWAVFFDALKIDWEYEPEGFVLPSGKKYLPDFKLFGFCGRGPEIHYDEEILWCEVKGVKDEDDLYKRKRDDYYKVEEFSNSYQFITLQNRCAQGEDISEDELRKAQDDINKIIILPNIPQDSWEWWQCGVTQFEFVDLDCWECIITKPNLSDKHFVLCGPDGDSRPSDYEIEITNSALKKAISAHFEFTEQDLQSLEDEVKILERKKELLDRKNELLKQIQGGNENGN